MSDAQRIVELAVGAAGPVGANPREWERRVHALAQRIAVMMRPPAPGHEHDATTPLVVASKVLDASVFRGVFVGFEVDDTKKRMFVRFRSDTADTKDTDADGTEQVRTEPWWTPTGRAMCDQVKAMAPGTPCIVYKVNDPIDNGKRSIRVLVHLEQVGAPPAGGEQQRPAPPSRPTVDEPPEPSGAVVDRYNQLTPTQRVAFGRLCRDRGIANFMQPADEDIDKVLVVLHEIESRP